MIDAVDVTMTVCDGVLVIVGGVVTAFLCEALMRFLARRLRDRVRDFIVDVVASDIIRGGRLARIIRGIR
jgi:hypothetical protein